MPIRRLVAHKGIGKSAVFRMSYLENIANNVLSIWVKPDDILGIANIEDGTDPLEMFRQCLKNHKIVIYVDDLDRAWNGSKQNIYRISALLNAVRDMCNETNELRFRISLRSDVYYLIRTADEPTDKIDGNVLWLTWTEHELLALLVKRVQSYFGNDIAEKELLGMK